MATQAEEQQAKEFLKRAEVHTMRKDLLQLREADALKERDKIAHIETLEEQKAKQEKKLQEDQALEKSKREEILQKNEGQERIAEKDLKNYATEQERQQIFLLESQRLGFEKQLDEIDKEKDPTLKLEKNKLLLQKRDWQAKLNTILDQEKKMESEQGFVAQKSQGTTIPSERKALEERRWDLDKEIQEIEKKRWEIEKQIEGIDNKAKEIDKSLEKLVTEKNGLTDRVLGIDKSVRDIYSEVINRVEEKRRAEEELKRTAASGVAKIRATEKEKIQKQQWSTTSVGRQQKEQEFFNRTPGSIKAKIMKSVEQEEAQRTKFLHDVDKWSKDKEKIDPQILQQKNAALQPPIAPQVPNKKQITPQAPQAPMPPHKN